MLVRPIIIFLISLLLSNTVFAQVRNPVLEAELKKLISDFKEDHKNAKSIAQYLKWTGIDDERLFDLVEKDLLERKVKSDNAYKERTSWKLQILSYSGKEKYRETISLFQKKYYPDKLKRNSRNSLAMLAQFAVYNPIISQNLEKVSKEELVLKRVENMLTSDNMEMVNAGARRVFHHHYRNRKALDMVEQALFKHYKHVDARRPDVDALAWICKVMGKTKDVRYIPILEEVKENAKSKYLRTFARRTANKIKYFTKRNKYYI